MPWNSTFPNGALSVKANQSIGQDNTTYIETTMGNSIVGTNTVTTRDHFWDVDNNLDGRHRFIQSVGFTVGGNPTDPVVGTGMDGVIYLKTTNTRVQGFYRNANGIYQFIPSFLSGTHSVTSSYTTITTLPNNVYGEIIMWRTTNGKFTAQTGFFRSSNSILEAWSLYLAPEGEDQIINLKFGNGNDVSGLALRVKTQAGSTGTWNYRITYRAM